MIFLGSEGGVHEGFLVVGIRIDIQGHLVGDHSPVHDLFVALRQVLQDDLADGFDLLLADQITTNPPPSELELKILREEVDKDRFYI